MRSDERAVSAPRPIDRSLGATDEAELRATCRRQAMVIETLMRAVGDLRTGASALKSENAELRLERRWLHRSETQRASAGGVRAEEQVSLGVHAPAMARRIVADALHEHVPLPLIERATLTISELVTNSVCHSASPDGGYAIVRVRLTDESLLLEVEDPGHGGPVVRRNVDARSGAGFGLHVVETLSERWGSERRASGAMRVWAELTVVPSAADEDAPPPEPCDEVHVVPDPRAGTWSVYIDENDGALSHHASETAAIAAAKAQAPLHRCGRIVVVDRYFRTRSMPVRAEMDAGPS